MKLHGTSYGEFSFLARFIVQTLITPIVDVVVAERTAEAVTTFSSSNPVFRRYTILSMYMDSFVRETFGKHFGSLVARKERERGRRRKATF